MIHKLKCYVEGCKSPVRHSRMLRTVTLDACATHAHEAMRCKSGNIDTLGECFWCDATNGESCRFKHGLPE